jgi:hypothetical protein
MKTEFNSYLWWIFENGQDTTGDFDPSLYGWRTYGDLGLVLDANTRYPTFYAMKLMQHFVQPGDTILNPTSDQPLLSVYAASNSSGTVSLLVINKDPTNTLTSDVTLAGYIPSAVATVYAYGMAQDESAQNNGSLTSQDIAVSGFSPVSSDFAYAFPPYSLTLFTFAQAGAPLLGISYSGNQVIVSWDPSATGWTLQTNSNLSTGTWGNYLGAIFNNSVTNAPPTGNVFFRLKQ